MRVLVTLRIYSRQSGRSSMRSAIHDSTSSEMKAIDRAPVFIGRTNLPSAIMVSSVPRLTESMSSTCLWRNSRLCCGSDRDEGLDLRSAVLSFFVIVS